MLKIKTKTIKSNSRALTLPKLTKIMPPIKKSLSLIVLAQGGKAAISFPFFYRAKASVTIIRLPSLSLTPIEKITRVGRRILFVGEVSQLMRSIESAEK